MEIYLILLFVVITAVYLAEKSRSKSSARFFLGTAFTSMVLVAGLRDRIVGTDTGNYIGFFERVTTLGDVLVKMKATKEVGFGTLSLIVHLFSDDYVFFLLSIAIIVVGFYCYAITKYSTSWMISFYIFVTMGFYTFFFNGARQGVACAVSAVALKPLMQRKFLPYLSYILLATLFHKSALIMLPVYFVVVRRNNLKTIFMYLVLAVGGALSLQKIVEIGSEFDARYASFADSGEGGGYLIVGFNIALALFFMLHKRKVRWKRYEYDIYLNLFILGVLIGIISSVLRINPSGILRFMVFFNISVVFLWPLLLQNIKFATTRSVYQISMFVGYIVFFILTTCRFSALVPYTINSTLKFF